MWWLPQTQQPKQQQKGVSSAKSSDDEESSDEEETEMATSIAPAQSSPAPPGGQTRAGKLSATRLDHEQQSVSVSAKSGDLRKPKKASVNSRQSDQHQSKASKSNQSRAKHTAGSASSSSAGEAASEHSAKSARASSASAGGKSKASKGRAGAAQAAAQVELVKIEPDGPVAGDKGATAAADAGQGAGQQDSTVQGLNPNQGTTDLDDGDAATGE